MSYRNYDYILKHGHAQQKNIYYSGSHIKVTYTFILMLKRLSNDTFALYIFNQSNPPGLLTNGIKYFG